MTVPATHLLSFPDWMGSVQTRVEAALARSLPPGEAIPARLHQAMRYASLAGGKRVRPLLVFAAGELAEASAARLEVAASAVELIHGYSLVHDDLPCMDDDVLRRGRPTCHVEYDEATALLVGDSLQSLAFELLAREEYYSIGGGFVVSNSTKSGTTGVLYGGAAFTGGNKTLGNGDTLTVTVTLTQS